jgi:hypothetical protein
MKKLFLNVLFLNLALGGFSQPAFTEITLADMHQKVIIDGVKSAKEDFSPDFIMIGHEGQICDHACLEDLNINGGMIEWPVEGIKIRQSGNIAVASGITHHKGMDKKSKATWVNNERFTETYEYQKGKWMWVAAHYTQLQTDKAAEVEAVKKTLVDERKVFHAGDKEGMLKYWKNDPNSFVLFSGSDGGFFHMDSAGVQKAIAGFKPNDQSVGTITNSKIQVYGNNAVADLDMTVTQKNGISVKSHNIVHLEKDGTAWKVIGYSIHEIPNDKEADTKAIKTLVEKETTAWHARDVEGMTACWANTEYAMQSVYHGVMAMNNGVAYRPNTKKDAPERFKTIIEGRGKPDGSTFKNENYVIHVNGASAIAYFDQTTINGDGSKSLLYSTRYLERINGEWKIVYVGGITHK